MDTVQEGTQLGTGWIEFSERHARAASSDFARSVVQYFNSTYTEGARHIGHKDLLKKFIDCFSENFEYEYLRRSVQQGNSKVSLVLACVHEFKFVCLEKQTWIPRHKRKYGCFRFLSLRFFGAIFRDPETSPFCASTTNHYQRDNPLRHKLEVGNEKSRINRDDVFSTTMYSLIKFFPAMTGFSLLFSFENQKERKRKKNKEREIKTKNTKNTVLQVLCVDY